MKKVSLATFVFVVLMSCNSGTADNTPADSNAAKIGSEGVTDTTHQADGTVNSSAISTDTAAMNTSKALQKKDSAQKK